MKFGKASLKRAGVTFVTVTCAALLTVQAGAAKAEQDPLADLPSIHHGGTWDSGHVQGVAVDLERGHIYYSFTNLLAKYDLQGRLIGTLVGWTGHRGELAFNPADGKLYGSLEYKADQAFYIAVIDVAGLDRVGVEASESDLFKTVHLDEVAKDYAADLVGDGRFDGDVAATRDWRDATRRFGEG
ncbi:hypothetical protein [Brevundimonas guildfordensis]|uniref:Phytase-like domain-containing protein n=1 Tax=Brevundimonas guildfordensis TaxID=2762241 RepID=A0ABR8QXH1_9CAUL|nr:hypothetical protein [Brevundimonas guildfordensis]MBD7940233.1 hypothetical protein [Brevundimonas guildfordensis]